MIAITIIYNYLVQTIYIFDKIINMIIITNILYNSNNYNYKTKASNYNCFTMQL